MKASVLSTAAVLSLASTGLAQTTKQSKPFQLVIQSTDKSLNGKVFDACHEGAAIEGLCVSTGKADAYNTYRFNTTTGQTVPNKNLGPTGVLTWELQGGNFNESEAMQFYYDPSTNVALPLFEPSNNPTYVGFDKSNKMHIQSYLDDTKNPPTDTEVHALYRWYACTTNFEGYTYQTLSWVLGNGKPQNPSCKKIDVVRKFV